MPLARRSGPAVAGAAARGAAVEHAAGFVHGMLCASRNTKVELSRKARGVALYQR